mgnify:CR=1 FL=1
MMHGWFRNPPPLSQDITLSWVLVAGAIWLLWTPVFWPLWLPLKLAFGG